MQSGARVRIGYLECFAGISGDMLLGALVDAGVDPALLRRVADSLGLGVALEFVHVDRSGIRSVKAKVMVGGREADAPAENGLDRRAHTHDHSHAHDHLHTHDHDHSHNHDHAHPHDHSHTHGGEHLSGAHEHEHGRTLPIIQAILARAEMAEPARQMALAAFEYLGKAEGRIHGVPMESVHFHEVGAIDAIVDIACAAAGLHALGVERWYSSAINVGGGFVDCAHGRFPVPAPATAELLKGMPTYSSGMEAELVTPTGAALLKALGCDFTASGVAEFHSVGYGAGTRNPPRFPNVLRLSVGQAADSSQVTVAESDTVAVLECAVDDLSPQVIAYATQRALEQGALDVMCTSVVMKKGRLGTLITLLCHEADAARMQQLLFTETTTLGTRVRREQRVVLERRTSSVETAFGTVRVKTGYLAGQPINAQPEYEDCRVLAEAHHVPLKEVMQAATAAAQQGLQPLVPARATSDAQEAPYPDEPAYLDE